MYVKPDGVVHWIIVMAIILTVGGFVISNLDAIRLWVMSIVQ